MRRIEVLYSEEEGEVITGSPDCKLRARPFPLSPWHTRWRSQACSRQEQVYRREVWVSRNFVDGQAEIG